MIIRRRVENELILVGQTDHSRFVGQLAAHWGHEDISAPIPYASMARAAIFHDYGWLRYETSPLIHPKTGEPYAQFTRALENMKVLAEGGTLPPPPQRGGQR